ncbi:hypothetical protein [Neptunomonas japonica]|uniref:hypothetical protein n=1 Tax=Neptunomonas japonica TaxID=417574 RepID=UPI0003F87D0B|nr:hypothetical protein [Neptunomonas japonica]
MKKFFKYLGFGVLSVVVFFVAIIVITSVGGIDKEETFPPYIEEAIPKLTTWEIEQYKLLMSKEGMEAATPEQWQLYLNMFKKLGTLQKVGTPELQNSRVASMTSSGTTTYATYLVPLTFDTGEAHVQLGLQHNSETIEINNVRFLSDLLLK